MADDCQACRKRRIYGDGGLCARCLAETYKQLDFTERLSELAPVMPSWWEQMPRWESS